MIAYKKQRRKVDPVKQILARLDEKQNKSGLSLYSRTDVHEPAKEDVLPMVHPFNEATSVSSKNSSFFPDLSAARQKAHRRLNAGLQHAIDDSDQKAALYMQAKADKRLNMTFPPVKSQGMTAAMSQDRQGYAFSGWSDSPSAGVESFRHNHQTSMNPFGYSRRTLAFQPTSLNYVVEWPETWPLKIMSLSKGTGQPRRKKTKPKPKVYRRVHFQNSPAPCTSRHILKQPSTENAAVPLPDQSKQVLPEIHNPLTSAATGATLPQSPVIEDHIHKKEVEEFSQAREDLKENTHRNMLDVEERHSSDNPQVYSESSSISESNFARTFEAQTTGVPHDTENQQADSVPPCTPTPDKTASKDLDDEQEDVVDSLEDEDEEGNEDSHDLLMGIVSEIAAETPAVDYMQDI